MQPTVFGSIEDPGLAERLIGALLEAGVAPEDLSLLISEPGGGGDRGFADADEGVTMVESGENGNNLYGHAAVQTEGSYTYESQIGGGISTSSPDDSVSGVEEMDDSQKASEDMTYPASAQSFSSQERFDVAQGVNTGFFNTTKPGPEGFGSVNTDGILPDNSELTSLHVPGIGLVIGDGGLATSVIGAGIATERGGNPAVGLRDYLRDQAVPNELAWMLANEFEQGGAVVAIAAPPGAADSGVVQQVLESIGAKNVRVVEAAD